MTIHQDSDGMRLLRPIDVCIKLGYRKSWLWSQIKNDPDFPRPIYLNGIAPRFVERDVDQWISIQAAKPRQPKVTPRDRRAKAGSDAAKPKAGPRKSKAAGQV